MINKVGREIPPSIKGRILKSYQGPFHSRQSGLRKGPRVKSYFPDEPKVYASLENVLKTVG